MTYDPAIPQPADLIATSQGQLLTNYSELNLVYGDPVAGGGDPSPNSDHFPFDDGSTSARKHRKVRLPRSAVFPTPDATDGVIYTKVAGTQTIPFYRKDSGTLDFPLLPVRAMVRFTIADGVIIGTALNATVTMLSATTFRINFIEILPDAFYLVSLTQTRTVAVNTTAVVRSGTIANNQFEVVVQNGLELHVVVLHYVTV